MLEHQEKSPAALDTFNDSNAADIIVECGEKLNDLNSLTERDFLSAGRELHTIHTQAKRISEAAISASELVTGQEVLKNIEGLQQVFDLINSYFHQSQSELQHSSEELTKMIALANGVHSSLSSFGRIVKHLHILGISTKIENARIMSSDNSFYLLAEDVEKLSLVISARSDDINKGLILLQRSIESALSKILGLKDKEYNKAQSALDNTRMVLSTLLEKKLTSAETARNLADRSRDVSTGISNIVSSLQFHDITRQQIEHVVETLNDVRVMGSSEDKNKNVVAALMGHIGDLQIHQLKNAREEFMSAVRRVMEDLQGVAHNVQDMSREARTLLGSTGENGSSFLAEVTSSLSSVISFSIENEDTHRGLLESLNSISGTMGELSEFVAHIEGIGSEIELIALNALVKAAHSAADGAALGIIAEAITKLSEGARNQTLLIADMLRDMHDAALRINIIREKKDDETNGDIQELTKNAESLSNSAQQSDEKIMYLLNNLEKEATGLTFAIDTIVNNVSAHKKMDAITTDIIGQLDRLVKYGRTVVVEEGSEMTTEYLNNLTNRYTMDQERFIHQSHIGVLQRNVEVGFNGNHLGDNVELF